MTSLPRIPLPSDLTELVEYRLATGGEPPGDVLVPLVRLLAARWRRRQERERLAARQATGDGDGHGYGPAIGRASPSIGMKAIRFRDQSPPGERRPSLREACWRRSVRVGWSGCWWVGLWSGSWCAGRCRGKWWLLGACGVPVREKGLEFQENAGFCVDGRGRQAEC